MNPGPLAHSRTPAHQTVVPLVCLLTTGHPERALSRALVEHLTEEMPDIRFTLDRAAQPVDVIWLCGYESGHQGQIRDLRRSHPGAVLVVTAKEPRERWAGEVEAGGADCALSWPLDYGRLSAVLHRRMVQRPA